MNKVEKHTEYLGHKGSIFALEVSQDEHSLYSSGDDGMVVRWDLRAPSADGEGLIRVGKAVYALAEIPDRNWLAVGSSDGTVYMVDLAAKRVCYSYQQNQQAIYSLYHEAAQDLLWVMHGGGFLSIIRLSDFSLISMQQLAQHHLRAWAVLPQLDRIAIASSDQHIYILNRNDAQVVQAWPAHDNSVFTLLYHPEAQYLLSGGRDAQLKLWNPMEGKALQPSIPAHMFTVNDLALSPDNRHVISASRDKTLKLWDAHHFRLKKVINLERNESHSHSVNKVRWLRSDNSVISCSDDRRIIRWRFTLEPTS